MGARTRRHHFPEPRVRVLVDGELTSLKLTAAMSRSGKQQASFRERGRPFAAADSPRELSEHALASLPAGLVVARGRELIIELVNPAFQALAPGTRLVGRPFSEVAAHIQRMLPVLERVLATGQASSVPDMELSIRRQVGG